MDFLEYTDVAMESRGTMAGGKLTLTDERVSFEGKASANVASKEIELVNWQRMAGTWGIRVFTTDGKLHRFAGFKDAERERLARFFKSQYSLDMLDRELSVKGWNWGSANFDGGVLKFVVGKDDAYDIPLEYVNQCVPGKNEVTLEFHSVYSPVPLYRFHLVAQNDDAAVMLTEMRFHIPSSEQSSEDPVEAFKERVMERASVVTTSGDAMAIFREIHCLSPRGRYDIKIFPTYMNLHGKTFDYKIPASSVMRLFLLPHKDHRQMHFAVNVDPPIKQGQTRYHYLVLNFKQEDEVELELPFTEEELKSKFGGALQQEMRGPTVEVLSKILAALTQRRLTVPGKFKGHSGTPVINCSHKAASGLLYPLERGLIFIYKPPIYIRYDEMRAVGFERSGGSTRSFDIEVITTNDIAYTFSSIEKGEYGRLYDYLKERKVNVKSSGKSKSANLSLDAGGHVDHHLEKVKKDAEEMSDDASMSSDDTDFNPDDLEALSAREEYDSDPSTSSSSDISSGEDGNTSDAERKREEKQKRREERAKQKAQRAEKRGSGGDKEKKKRQKKKSKLPGQPKRNQSAYFIWLNENRERIKNENPDLSMTDLGKKGGELWRAIEDKSEWEEKAAEDKKRYEAELEKWKTEGGGNEAIAAMKKEKRRQKRAEKEKKDGQSKPSGSSQSSPTKSKSVDPKGKAGPGFKSKEFIDESGSTSSDD